MQPPQTIVPTQGPLPIAISPLNLVPVAVIDPDPATRDALAAQLGDRAAPMASISALDAQLDGRPVVMVLGPSCGDPVSLAEASMLLRSRPEVGAVLVSDELSTDVLRAAMRAGAKDVLAAPVDTDALVAAVDMVGDTLEQAPDRSPLPLRGAPGAGGDEPATPAEVITVFSTKGGSGKSVLAVNLAVSLAERGEGPVVLLDADLQFGDVAVMLRLAPKHTIADAVASAEGLDANLLQQLLIEHEPSGLLVLPAPLEPSLADQIDGPDVIRIVQLLRSFCAYVVIDTSAYFNDVVLGLIDESDDVLLVAGLDIPNIKNMKIGLQTLRLLDVPMSKLHLVLNRADSKVKLDVKEVERTLQVKAEALIPSDVVVPQTVNRGTALVLEAPKSGVAKSIERLADRFAPAERPKRGR
jgi:pilus assembly protein CpaE